MRSLQECVYQTMTLEPLKTALSADDVGETSLALPSDRGVRSAQQRVLDQVSTLKRSRSKYRSRSTSGTLSPTSPPFDNVFTDYKHMCSSNGFESSINGQGKMKHGFKCKSTSSWGTTSQRNHSLNMYPTIPPPASLPRMNTDIFQVPGTSQKHRHTSKVERKSTMPSFSKPVNQFPVNGIGNKSSGVKNRPDLTWRNEEKRAPDITLREAVDCLSCSDENYQQCGASYIQHCTFTDDSAKKEVMKLGGIRSLVELMGSSSPQVQLSSAAALRNLVFKDQAIKEEVQKYGGVANAVQLLRDTDCAETQKHVTGLLWNLSSVDSLKPELLRSALPVLTQTVLEPFTATPDHNSKSDTDAETFFNATGCLRNLSCGTSMSRQAMRNCKGLVDALNTYVQNCVSAGHTDDKSLENCVCVLHNLTYQLESESPAVFTKMHALASRANRNTNDTGPISCFSSQSRKIQQESPFDYPVIEENVPKGQNWLIHSQALQSYLTLMGTSTNESIKEACCGTLQNLTASKGLTSDVLSQTIVQKLNGLRQITPLLNSDNQTMKSNVMSLMGNFSRTPRLQSMIARQALPQLARALTSSVMPGEGLSPASDLTMATACNTLSTLIRAEPHIARGLLNNSLVNSLNNLTQNIGSPNAGKAAGALLHSLWSDKTTQSILKRQGLNKKSFVNDITSAAIKSIQVIE